MKLDIALILSFFFVPLIGSNAIATANTSCSTIDLIERLSSDNFAIREPARKELTEILGDREEASATREAIRTALRDCGFSLEATRRLENLVKLWDLSDVGNWSTIMRDTISNGGSTDTKILAARDILTQIKNALLSNTRLAEIGNILQDYDTGLIELSDASRAELLEEYNDILRDQILPATYIQLVRPPELVNRSRNKLAEFGFSWDRAKLSAVVQDCDGTEYSVTVSETKIEVKSNPVTWIDLPLQMNAQQGVQGTGNSVRLPLPTVSWERPRGSSSGSIVLSWPVSDNIFALSFLTGLFPDLDFSTAERDPNQAASEAETTIRTGTQNGSGQVNCYCMNDSSNSTCEVR